MFKKNLNLAIEIFLKKNIVVKRVFINNDGLKKTSIFNLFCHKFKALIKFCTLVAKKYVAKKHILYLVKVLIIKNFF